MSQPESQSTSDTAKKTDYKINGKTEECQRVHWCHEYAGCDEIMSSEALLENLKMFSEQGDYEFRTDYCRAQINTVKEFFAEADSYTLPVGTEIPNIRGHLFKMLHRMVLAPVNADLLKQMSSKFTSMREVAFCL